MVLRKKIFGGGPTGNKTMNTFGGPMKNHKMEEEPKGKGNERQ
jgi:hypothetical protein